VTRVVRILAVTAGLGVAGAVLGAVASVVALLLATAITEGPSLQLHLDVLAFVAGFGAVCGSIAAPAGGWLLLRHVPLGKAMLWSVTGTVLGGVIAWMTSVGHNQIGRAVLGAVLGFLVAALLVRWTTPRVRQTRDAKSALQS
jgi:drug/metabolite transporter superfamily protein YnfA